MDEQLKKSVSEFGDWELILVSAHHSYTILNLSEVERSNLYKAVYSCSNGYGEKGYVPVQGYDWSGIRDSSDAAMKEMAEAARDYLEKLGVLDLVYVKRS